MNQPLFIVATHNFRLQCLFTKIANKKDYKNYAFKNCAIIRNVPMTEMFAVLI